MTIKDLFEEYAELRHEWTGLSDEPSALRMMLIIQEVETLVRKETIQEIILYEELYGFSGLSVKGFAQSKGITL